jgi:hypothetical protein
MFQTETVDPFSFDRLYGKEKYNLNGMQMKAVNFPAEVDPGHATAVWSDRIITTWWDAAQKIQTHYNGDAYFGGATDESFMQFAKDVALAINFKHDVTGARVTRYTNAASGYPVFVLEVTHGGKGIRETTQPKRPRRYVMDHLYGEMVAFEGEDE